MFHHPHYALRNIRRREMRNIRKNHSLRSEVKQLKRKVSDYEKVICQLQQEIKTVKNCKDKSLKHLQKQCELSSLDFMKLEAEFETYVCKIHDDSNTTPTSHTSSESPFTFQTKDGKRYSPIIRTLYYSLLTSQVPPNKIAGIIKDILSGFFSRCGYHHIKATC